MYICHLLLFHILQVDFVYFSVDILCFTNRASHATIAFAAQKRPKVKWPRQTENYMNLTASKDITSKGSALFATFTEENITIDYTLICDERDTDKKIYSLAISLREDSVCVNSCYLCDISCDEQKAHNIFDKFSNLGVSPAEAPTVISEMASPFYNCNF